MIATDVIALALLPAFLWGISPVLSKRGMAGGGSSLQAAMVLVTVNGVASWGLLVLTTDGSGLLAGLSPPIIAVFLIGGVIGTALCRLALYAGIDRVGASVNNAVLNTHPVFATLFALGWLGEAVTIRTGIGILVLTGGLVVLTLAKGGDHDGWTLRDLTFPLIAALTYAIGNVLRRFGLTASNASTLQGLALNEIAAFAILATYAVLFRRRDAFTVPRKTYLYFTGSGVLTAIALFAMFEALRRGNVAIVSSLSAMAPLFTVLWASILLKDLERVTKGVTVGASFVVMGAILIAI